MNLAALTIAEAARALRAKDFSARELMEEHLAVIRAKDTSIHAYLEVWEKEARTEADLADKALAAGEAMPLTGIPLAIKDNILIKGRIASSASKILETYTASYDATVTEKLKKQKVVFLGRTNMDEFAMGSSTENSAFGPTKNPHDLSRVPGGSSGGSAAAVASSMALAALGSDTGGSIRQPASHCGLVGLKPTYGSVSRFGLMPMGSSLDVIGPLTKTVGDAKILYDAIRGHDSKDGTTYSDSFYPKATERRVIGVPRKFIQKGVDPDVLARFEASLDAFRASGYTIVDIEMPNLSYALPVYYIICPAEVSTNLARYDGVRYGARIEGASLQEMYEKTRGAFFGPETRRRVILGTFVLSAGYADAYYRRARAVRDLIRSDFSRTFETVDAIAMPTAPGPAFKIGEKTSDPLAMYLEDIFSVTANLAGVPAISLPAGTVMREGVALPVGLQLVAPHGGDYTLFTLGESFERSIL